MKEKRNEDVQKAFEEIFGYEPAEDEAEQACLGEFSSLREYAYHVLEDLYDIPGHLMGYFDMDQFVGDLEDDYEYYDGYIFHK